MPEKPNIFRSLKDFGGSISFKPEDSSKIDTELEKKKEEKKREKTRRKILDNPYKKYAAINVGTKQREGSEEGEMEEDPEQDSIPQPTSEQKLRATRLDTSDFLKGRSGYQGEESEEYINYQNERGRILDSIRKKQFTGRILNKLNKAEKRKLLTYPESVIQPKNDIIEAPSMPEKVDIPKVSPEKNGLKPEDLKLQKAVYESLKKCKVYLNDQVAINKKDKKSANDLKEFEQDPYAWMRLDLMRRLDAGADALGSEKIQSEKRKILDQIVKNKLLLENLKQAKEKNLPLKLDKQFNSKEMPLDSGRLFKIRENIKEINEKLRGASTAYDITGIVRRGNENFIALTNDQGEEKYIQTDKVEEIVREKDPKYIKKIETFNKIKAGDIVYTKIGTKGNKPGSRVWKLRIEDIKGDRVFFDNLSERERKQKVTRGNMSKEEIKNLLIDDRTDLYIEESPYKKEQPNYKNEKGVDMYVDPTVVKVGELKREIPMETEVAAKIEKERVVESDENKKQKEEKVKNLKQRIKEIKEALELSRQKDKEEWGKKQKEEEELRNISPSTADLVNLPGKENIERGMDAVEKNENKIEVVEAEKLRSELKNILNEIMNDKKVQKKKPELKAFEVDMRSNGFKIDAIININKTGNILMPQVTINLEMLLMADKEKDDELTLKDYAIYAGAATGVVKKELGPLLSQITPQIQSHFERKLGKKIESMKVEEGNLKLYFKE